MGKKKMGRPTKYTKKLGDEICGRMGNGESLLKICKSEKMPSRRTVYRWYFDNRYKDFRRNYDEAQEMRIKHMADEIIEIADESEEKEPSNRSRLRVDARKWTLSKMDSKNYGEKIDVTSAGKGIGVDADSVRKIDEFIKKQNATG